MFYVFLRQDFLSCNTSSFMLLLQSRFDLGRKDTHNIIHDKRNYENTEITLLNMLKIAKLVKNSRKLTHNLYKIVCKPRILAINKNSRKNCSYVRRNSIETAKITFCPPNSIVKVLKTKR